MMRKLAVLMQPWINEVMPECEILGLQNDSRQIQAGYLFLAYPGAAADGRLYINQAITLGARAIVYEPHDWPPSVHLPSNIPCIALPGLDKKLAEIASRFFGEPSKRLTVTGITGTTGKTTIAHQLAQAHELLGNKAAYVGTLGQGIINAPLQPLLNTTPDAICLQSLLSTYCQQDIKQVCMEVSSHALSQHRVDQIDFRQALFTNLSHEHLDYHRTMEAYAAAKAQLFAKSSLQWAIVNQDDKAASLMQAVVPKTCQLLSYGLQQPALVRAVDWDVSLSNTRLQVVSPWGHHEFKVQSLGFFSVYNALAIFTSLVASGYAIDKIITVMEQLQPVAGRMEIVAQQPCTLVDYAHKPDALENVLQTLQTIKKQRLLVVFGCGGNRDKAKRPMMGKIASDYADIVILTNDNPRHEDPLSIIAEIQAGVKSGVECYSIPSREEAIGKALSLADKDDIILIAGKGHEPYQEIGDVRYPFSDQEVIKRLRLQE